MQRVAEWLADLLGVSHLLQRRPDTLSGGERQKVALARALSVSPGVLLVDEPLSALDPQTREGMQQELRHIHQQLEATIIHVTHDFEEAIALGDRIAVLNEGRIVQVGTPEQIFRHPDSEFVARFSMTHNIFAGEVHQSSDGHTLFAIDDTEFEVVTELSGKLHASVRPEDILVSKEPLISSARNSLKGTITSISDRGSTIHLTVSTPLDFVCIVTRRSFDELNIEKGGDSLDNIQGSLRQSMYFRKENKMKKVVLGIIALAVMTALLIGCGCTSSPSLIILHAGSLSVPLDKMSDEFKEQNPGVNINTESAGSRTTIRKVTELGKPCDIIGSADYMAIEELMFPDFTDWYICFARNQMVIAYRDDAPFADDVVNGERAWYDVLRNEDVTFGHSDPDADPCGYRTLMVVQLAEKYYYDEAVDFNLTPDDNADDLYNSLIALPEGGTELDRGRIGGDWGEVVKPKSVDLLYLLESGDLDYAFEYRSVAQQHEFGYIELPTEIDLSRLEFEDFYATAEVEVTGSEPGTSATLTGAPIVYGLTIPTNAPNLEMAIDFVQFILGSDGQQILQDCGQPAIVPAVASDPEKVPQELADYVTHP